MGTPIATLRVPKNRDWKCPICNGVSGVGRPLPEECIIPERRIDNECLAFRQLDLAQQYADEKEEVVFSLFEDEGTPPFLKKRAISSIKVGGNDVEFSIPVPKGHPEIAAYRAQMDLLAEALEAKNVREYGLKGWMVDFKGEEASVGVCEAAYPPGEKADRPDLTAVAKALRSANNIRVPHVPWPRYHASSA